MSKETFINNNVNEIIKKRFNRTSLFYDCMDKMLSDKWRKKALSYAKGRVLEVGIGTGKNLSLYPRDIKLTGIDFSPGMLKKARAKAQKLNISEQVSLEEMDVQNLSFPDDYFDTVVATCVFCSVPDPIQGLKEIRRVCKPSGKVILLEHMRSDNPILGKIMDILNPVTLYLIGSNINRKTMENLKSAKLEVLESENIMGELVKFIIAKP